MLNHLSLFSGIGGFDLASEWMGWNNIAHCEINPFCRKILKYYWPDSISYEDITKTDFTVHRGAIDILTGGFPCQPYSVAGNRQGTEDSRHLWPEMLRAIREVQPSWIIGENVPGLINWNDGLVFEQVQADLETEGYEVQPFILPAASVDAPHRRDRVFFVAYSKDNRHKRKSRGGENGQQRRLLPSEFRTGSEFIGGSKTPSNPHQFNGNLSGFRTSEIPQQQKTGILQDPNSNTYNERLQGDERYRENESENTEWGKGTHGPTTQFHRGYNWASWPTQPPVCNGNDGFPARLDFEAVFAGIKKPRKANTFGKWRTESIKAAGNAIVPQVALQIFKAIEQYNNLTTK